MLPDYLVLGHITRDLVEPESAVLGGTALYAATTAHRLGLQAAAFTATADQSDVLALPFAVAQTPSAATSTFENRYLAGQRQQWLHAEAAPLDLTDLPSTWRATPIVHLGPVLHECSLAMLTVFPDALIGVTPQGWMRRWQQRLPALIQPASWQPDPDLLRRVDLLALSIEDVVGDEAVATRYARMCRLVALTRGAAGLTLYVDGVPHHIPAAPADEADPTGAGDVFTAAMLVRLRETSDPFAAAAFAAAIAARSVEGYGVSHIPTRAEAL